MKYKAENQRFERIKNWALSQEENGRQLSEHDKRAFERYDSADNLLRKYPVKKHVAELLKKKYDISTASAYRDIEAAETIFNSVNRINKEFLKRWLIEDAMTLIAKAKGQKKRILEDGTVQDAIDTDFKAWNQAHSNLIKILGFDREDSQLPDPALFEQHNYYAVIMINGTPKKMTEKQFLELPTAKKNEVIEGFYAPIDEKDAKKIMIDGKSCKQE
ncbi:MAG: hypothetical protein U9Q69_02680 [Nanoarchaeota archaeon]|nr:hypothetical protein [Nanoarchaeota archaeon]